jgi:N-acetylmuramoyl-L-alanine amidase
MRVRARLLLVVLLAVGAGAPVRAAASARSMYAASLERERTVRSAALSDRWTPEMLPDLRRVVASYELLVKQHPASGYADDALWQGGRLALDAYLKFGEQRDKAAAIRLLRWLESGYPASKFARQVAGQLATIGEPAAPREVPPVPPAARVPAPPGRATIKEIRRALLPDMVRVIVELDAEVEFHDERLKDPERVFVDLYATRVVPPLVDQTLRFDGDGDIVRQVRIGRHPNSTVRVVLDAAGVSAYSAYPLHDPNRIVIDCVRSSPSAAAEPPPALLASRAVTTEWGRRLPSAANGAAPASRAPAGPSGPTPTGSGESADAAPSTRPEAAGAASAGPPPRNSSGRFSIARQLGLGVSRIVVDPGHGGHDPGAQVSGINEADLVLDVALRLEKLLVKNPGTEVILTRRTDAFVPLQERTAIANREGADLFLSIHANASDVPSARGVETYFLNFANNLGAAAVAARENAASGQAMGALPDIVKAIALNNKLDESRDFAAEIQRALVQRLRAANKSVKDLGVRQAPFVVLIGAAMPSVLAEISFITNPQEAKFLRSAAYRQRIAEALSIAIRKYQTSLKGEKAVAQKASR